ncbi:MAG TPA: hypothetical protein VFD01_01765 [Candidatus Dormibacteraeota bacterium]|nr:hypothetical protein [Candidatus Dormibacteraeota bacterium]
MTRVLPVGMGLLLAGGRIRAMTRFDDRALRRFGLPEMMAPQGRRQGG